MGFVVVAHDGHKGPPKVTHLGGQSPREATTMLVAPSLRAASTIKASILFAAIRTFSCSLVAPLALTRLAQSRILPKDFKQDPEDAEADDNPEQQHRVRRTFSCRCL